MEQLTRSAITNLVKDDAQSGPFVTIYAPTHRAATPPNMTEDQIRLKNLIREACKSLDEHIDVEAVCTMLHTKLAELEADMTFWEGQTEGLLICAHGTGMHMFHLPIDTEEYVAVDDQYHLAPAMALVSDAHSYYVLGIDQQQPTLYKGDSFGLQATDLHLPKSIADALHLDELNQKTEQQRSDSGAGSHAGTANGRGGARDPREHDRQHFWRIIDHQIINYIDTKLPLILVGTGSEIAEFRATSHYPHILNDWIEGSLHGMTTQDLFVVASEIIDRDIISIEHSAAIEEYDRLAGANPERIASSNQAIDEAAGAGRIDTLLLGIHRMTTDTVRDTMNAVPMISFANDAQQQAMSNRIAQQVFSNSGRVLAIEQDAMPQHAKILARLRY